MNRMVVFRPDPTSGWRVQQEKHDGALWQVVDHKDFAVDGKFSEAHEWALVQHPGSEVFVPQGAYLLGMTPEEDVAQLAKSGLSVVEVAA